MGKQVALRKGEAGGLSEKHCSIEMRKIMKLRWEVRAAGAELGQPGGWAKRSRWWRKAAHMASQPWQRGLHSILWNEGLSKDPCQRTDDRFRLTLESVCPWRGQDSTEEPGRGWRHRASKARQRWGQREGPREGAAGPINWARRKGR